MKKVLLTIVLCAMALVGYAQKGEMMAGAQFILGAGQGITTPGLGAKFSYSITDPWRLAASANYGFKNKGISTWDVNVDAHYQFFFGKGMRAYPLAGFTVMGYHYGITPEEGFYGDYDMGDSKATHYSANSTCVGVNLGGGFQYDINNAWAVYTEMKGQLVSKHGSRFVWSIGGAYRF